jgi:hypothetical protein
MMLQAAADLDVVEVETYHGVPVAGGGGCRRALASLTGDGGLSEQLMEETAMIESQNLRAERKASSCLAAIDRDELLRSTVGSAGPRAWKLYRLPFPWKLAGTVLLVNEAEAAGQQIPAVGSDLGAGF